MLGTFIDLKEYRVLKDRHGLVTQSDGRPTGIQEVAGSMSGNILS